jgi:hypothetical protein
MIRYGITNQSPKNKNSEKIEKEFKEGKMNQNFSRYFNRKVQGHVLFQRCAVH